MCINDSITIPEVVFEHVRDFIMDAVSTQLDGFGLTSDFQLQSELESAIGSATTAAYSRRRLELDAMKVECASEPPNALVVEVLVTAEGYPVLSGLVTYDNNSESPTVWFERADAQKALDAFSALSLEANVRYDDDAEAFTYHIERGWSEGYRTNGTLVAIHAVCATLEDPSGVMTNEDRALTVYEVLPDKVWTVVTPPAKPLQESPRDKYVSMLQSCRSILSDTLEQLPLDKRSRRTTTLLNTVIDLILDAD